jgi:hypothetical protein
VITILRDIRDQGVGKRALSLLRREGYQFLVLCSRYDRRSFALHCIRVNDKALQLPQRIGATKES